MALDNLTLLFSLALVSGLMAVSLAATSRSGQRDGLLLWAIALAFESAAWSLVAIRSLIPEVMSILLANLSLAVAQAIKLAALYQYRGLRWPRWQCMLPAVAMLLLLSELQVEDLRGRLIYGSLIYAVQMAMVAYALYADNQSKGSRAWWLIFGSTVTMLPILALRITAALHSAGSFTPAQWSAVPSVVQLLVFVSVVALELLGALGFILLVKERADQENRKLAMTDSLTGIFNRRAFMESAEREMASAQRNGLSFALLMLDLDNFKQINDDHGHATGDAVLVDVSKLMAARLRRQDTFGRHGGEEFCILLPATEAAGAMALAEELRKAVENNHLLIGNQRIAVTITIGVSVWHARHANAPADFCRILSDADRALYQGKAAGRNRTVYLPMGGNDRENEIALDPGAAEGCGILQGGAA